jgi:glycyl-tRNA synthetase
MSDVSLETIVSLCKRRGFIYQGSEVYGGLAGTWDYGPLGVALKRNIMDLWWKTFVEDRDDMLGVDAAILMNKKVWEASGHATGFNDPMVECFECHTRFRADHTLNESKVDIGKLTKRIKKIAEIYSQEPSLFQDHYSSTGEAPAYKLIEDELKEFPVLTVKSVSHQLDEILGYANKDFHDGEKYGDFPGQGTALALGNIGEIENKAKDIAERAALNTDVPCKVCGKKNWSGKKTFNMMFKTTVGPTAHEIKIDGPLNIPAGKRITFQEIHGAMEDGGDPARVYLRPETAQGIFTNYKNIIDSFYPDVPFGIAQQGKAFRNEISPRDFVFRSREFEQMEIEYFIHPDNWKEAFEKWITDIEAFLTELGLPTEKINKLEVPDADRAHYSQRTIDFEFDFPIGREELLGLAYRTDFDLQNIQKASGKSMEYRPKDGSPPFVPHVIEPSFGVERAIMAVLSAAYTEDEINGEKRAYLKLPANLAPVKVAVSPLLKNKPELVAKAREVYTMLKKEFGNVMWDDNGNIGKRYRRQDEIGTPYCVTIDFDTLEDNTVTIRHRDTAEQERLKIAEIRLYLAKHGL